GVEDSRDVADDAVFLDGALDERRPDAGVVDSLLELADEQSGDRLGAAVMEEVRELEECIDTGGDDDVEIDRGVDPLDARDAAAEARSRRIDERPVPRIANRPELLDRIANPGVLVPVARAPHAAVVLERLGLEDDDVLVWERAPQLGRDDGPADGLHRGRRLRNARHSYERLSSAS